MINDQSQNRNPAVWSGPEVQAVRRSQWQCRAAARFRQEQMTTVTNPAPPST